MEIKTTKKHKEAHARYIEKKARDPKGKKTRFQKGDPNIGRYQRSAETMARLKQKSFIKKTID